jgi:hypothetical protein
MPWPPAIRLVGPLAAIALSVACVGPGAPAPTPLPTPAVKGSPAAASPPPAASPSPAASPTVNPVTTGSEVVPAPAGAAITITSPAAGATVPAGDVRVTYDVASATLVAAAEARRVDDLHVHVLLDVDPAPFLGTTTFIPLGVPNIIHTAAKEATLRDVRPGPHTVTVILTGANHVSVTPPVSASTSFTAQ